MICALRVKQKAAPQIERVNNLIGHAVCVLAMTPTRRDALAAYIDAVLRPAAQHGQLRVYFDHDGAPVGVLVTAELGRIAHDRMVRTGRPALHFTEWNEGPNLWIMDLVAPFGHAGHILRKFGADRSGSLYYARPKRGRLRVKRIALPERR